MRPEEMVFRSATESVSRSLSKRASRVRSSAALIASSTSTARRMVLMLVVSSFLSSIVGEGDRRGATNRQIAFFELVGEREDRAKGFTRAHGVRVIWNVQPVPPERQTPL